MISKKIKYNLKYEPRQTQKDLLNFVKHQIRRGKKYMLINSPTGTGKSFFAIMFINWYLLHINKGARFDIITNSKVLQNQYTDEFPFIDDLKGQSNYYCSTYNCSCQEGKEMNKALKRKCNSCPYDIALEKWFETRVGLTNFHLFDSLHLFVPGHLERKMSSNVLIIDEADNFESVLCDYISMKISQRSLKLMGFNDLKIKKVYNEIKKVKSLLDYLDFINEFFLPELNELYEHMKTMISNNMIGQTERVKVSRYISSIESTIMNYEKFVSSLDDGLDSLNNWVIEKENEEKNLLMPINYLIQPIWSKEYLRDVIFKHYDHIVFMSGTILDKDIFAHLNGLETNLCSYYSINSPFPVKNRPIYFVKGIGKMTFANKVETWENQKGMLDKIIKKYKDKKGIIHTTNYEISRLIEEYYKNDDRFIFHTPETRDNALSKHMGSVKPTILVSPSMMQGVDLKDDLSRFQVIMKIPYPNIKSNKIKKRQTEYKDWYSWKTCADLIQMIGRSVRSEIDQADTYILDDSFSNILKFNYNFLPEYFIQSIKILKL
ncbi:MAG: helicase C-terminal domain-containing protein [Nanoarchaeota archaeon]